MKLIEIEIMNKESIVNVEADYIMLKNAEEGLFGPELNVNKVSGGLLSLLNKPEETKIGAVNIITNVSGTSAKGVILIGIGLGFQFRYKALGIMCKKMIETVFKISPPVKVIATVNHGVGFGLDRREVFLTQLVSFKSALEKTDKTLEIEKIRFNETKEMNVNFLKVYLKELSDLDESPIIKKEDKYFLQLGKSSEILTQFVMRVEKGDYVFVAMPFAEEFENVYDFGIRLPIIEKQFQPIRTDKKYFVGSVLREIQNRIQKSILVIADISTLNPNVMFELGYAQGCGKPTIIICRTGEKLPFNVSGMNIIFYNPHLLRELNDSLLKALSAIM
ncbi:MAG: hypothetical protein JSW00_14475 [Thermoplasmata archaeon]|nr:MAG: hypothetical protein JSW00_14475 [Thermoplasmata archaeon]